MNKLPIIALLALSVAACDAPKSQRVDGVDNKIPADAHMTQSVDNNNPGLTTTYGDTAQDRKDSLEKLKTQNPRGQEVTGSAAGTGSYGEKAKENPNAGANVQKGTIPRQGSADEKLRKQ